MIEHLDFILWMILYPVFGSLNAAIRWQWCERKKYEDGVKGISALIVIIIYFSVSYLLY